MKKIFLCLLPLFSLFSCSEKEIIDGRCEVYYYISDYFIPQKIIITTNSRNGSFYLILDTTYNHHISQKENPVEFEKLAREYGETGEKEFTLGHPPVHQPYNISNVRVYKKQNGKMIDVSEQSGIGYADYSQFVLSKYSGADWIPTSKKVSELTAHDLKWLPQYFCVSPPILEDPGEYYLVITLKSGEEFSSTQLENP